MNLEFEKFKEDQEKKVLGTEKKHAEDLEKKDSVIEMLENNLKKAEVRKQDLQENINTYKNALTNIQQLYADCNEK